MPAKKNLYKNSHQVQKKPTKAVAAAEQVDAATAVPNTYKHTCTGMNCCCDGVSVNKKPIKRARNTLWLLLLLLLFQQESQPTSSSNNGKPTNQTGRAEPAANANKQQQQQQQRQRKQLRRRFCGDCTFFQHTTRNTPPCGAQSASTATAAAATVPIRKVFQCSPATRRGASSQMLLEWRSLAPYMYVLVCLSERTRERERRCLPFVKFHYQFVSYETEMALQQQRSTTAGVAKKHVE